jgi:putative heme-binding domain-containing protein
MKTLFALMFFAVLVSEPRLAAQDHLGQYAQSDISLGGEVYIARCAQCHGSNGTNIGTANLPRGIFRRATTDDELRQLILKGIPDGGMPPTKLDDQSLTAIVAFIRAGLDVNARAVSVAVGDAARGRTIFQGKGGCLSCHRVAGEGSAVAPDLTDIGSLRTPAALRMSLVDPTSAMVPLNRPVRAVTQDGRKISGRRLNEDTYTVQLIDEQAHLVTLLKSDLRDYVILTASPMPSYRDKLTNDEIADVIGYLLSLREN